MAQAIRVPGKQPPIPPSVDLVITEIKRIFVGGVEQDAIVTLVPNDQEGQSFNNPTKVSVSPANAVKTLAQIETIVSAQIDPQATVVDVVK